VDAGGYAWSIFMPARRDELYRTYYNLPTTWLLPTALLLGLINARDLCGDDAKVISAAIRRWLATKI